MSAPPFHARNSRLKRWGARSLLVAPYDQVNQEDEKGKEEKVRLYFITGFYFYFQGLVNGLVLVTLLE